MARESTPRMRILCGTNFTQSATLAADVAAALARRTNQSLQLVHAYETPPERIRDQAELEHVDSAERMLSMEAVRLRDQGSVVHTRVLFGTPEQTILDCAEDVDAQLIVLGAKNRGESGHWSFHHRIDAIAAHAHGSVLVVRDAKPFREWASGARPLRILLGADDSATTDAALHFTEQLRELGPCEVSALHLFWPPEEFKRLGLRGVRSYLEVDPVVRATLARELGERLGDVKLVIEPHLGSYGERLARAGAEAHVDLIVVGSHQRTGASRVWHGSVSRAVLHEADLSVACVPLTAAKRARARSALQSAVAATDFSEIGNASIALACAAVAPGGTVHVVHVLPDAGRNPIQAADIMAADVSDTKGSALARTQLRALLPEPGAFPERKLLVHVLQSDRPAEAIAQAAERFDADVICVGTHGRTGLSRAVLGSVAQAVVAQTRRPVLLARTAPT
jgi:nucleotide-binding universal stress UspA family protein